MLSIIAPALENIKSCLAELMILAEARKSANEPSEAPSSQADSVFFVRKTLSSDCTFHDRVRLVLLKQPSYL